MTPMNVCKRTARSGAVAVDPAGMPSRCVEALLLTLVLLLAPGDTFFAVSRGPADALDTPLRAIVPVSTDVAMMELDVAQMTFGKTEPVLRNLPMKPSEYVQRQLRFTPFPTEDVGWMVDQCGPDLSSSRPITRTPKVVATRSDASTRAWSGTAPRSAKSSISRTWPA